MDQIIDAGSRRGLLVGQPLKGRERTQQQKFYSLRICYMLQLKFAQKSTRDLT